MNRFPLVLVSIGLAMALSLLLTTGCNTFGEIAAERPGDSDDLSVDTDTLVDTETDQSVDVPGDSPGELDVDPDTDADSMVDQETDSDMVTPGPGVSEIAAGAHTTCAVEDGDVYCWGDNDQGWLYNGDPGDVSNRPSQVGELSGIEQVAVGTGWACALADDDLVYCWGDNEDRQMGIEVEMTRLIPGEPVHDVAEATFVAAGHKHACAIAGSAGNVYCWGANGAGQTGTPNLESQRDPPGLVEWDDGGNPTALSDVVELSLGFQSSCARRSNGEVWCWGRGVSGELGIGNCDPPDGCDGYATPLAQQVSTQGGFPGANQLSVGSTHACAVDVQNRVWCWGSNTHGKTRGDTGNNPLSPYLLEDAENHGIVQIAAGDEHTCALNEAGDVFCWGWNERRQIGGGPGNIYTLDVYDWEPVTHINEDAEAIAAGQNHTCALKTDGSVWCWGSNELGSLGDGFEPIVYPPEKVPGTETASALGTGGFHTCANLGGTLNCWGYHYWGQMGIDNRNSTWFGVPNPVMGVDDPGQIDGGLHHTCAVEGEGALYCWGRAQSGQLGVQTQMDRLTAPQLVLSETTLVSSGPYAVCALDTQSRVHCWGWNDGGNAGVEQMPVAVELPNEVSISGVLGVSVGGTYDLAADGWGTYPVDETCAAASDGCPAHTCAFVSSSGATWCWGDNEFGQLTFSPSQMNDPWVPRGSPLAVNPVEICTGSTFTCARVDSGGSHVVRCWGDNTHGVLGRDPVSEPWNSSPLTVDLGVGSVERVFCGGNTVCALKADGLYCWGSNESGAAGLPGNVEQTFTPMKVQFPGDVIPDDVSLSPAIERAHGCALVPNDGVYCWGEAFDGQIGNGPMGWAYSAVEAQFP